MQHMLIAVASFVIAVSPLAAHGAPPGISCPREGRVRRRALLRGRISCPGDGPVRRSALLPRHFMPKGGSL
jgi:hypothetical protein